MSKPQCKKAKLLRLEKKQKKLLEKGLPVASVSKKEQASEKTLEDFIKEYSIESAVNKLEVRFIVLYFRSRLIYFLENKIFGMELCILMLSSKK